MTPRVLVTRASSQAGPLDAALRDLGLDPIGVPAIAVELDPAGGELENAARTLHAIDWVVITSPNGARAILAAAGRASASLAGPRWAAIGEATAEILERAGVRVDVTPGRALTRALAEALPVAPGEKVLLLRGDLASGELPRRLEDRGAVVTDVVAYRTIEGPSASRPMLRAALAAGRPDVVVFASGSAVRGLVALAGAEGLDVSAIPAVCIGPETARVAERLGFHVLATAPDASTGSLAATVAAALAEPLEIR